MSYYFVFIRHFPWPQGLRRDFDVEAFLIDFLRRPDPTPGHFRVYGGKPASADRSIIERYKRREAHVQFEERHSFLGP